MASFKKRNIYIYICNMTRFTMIKINAIFIFIFICICLYKNNSYTKFTLNIISRPLNYCWY